MLKLQMRVSHGRIIGDIECVPDMQLVVYFPADVAITLPFHIPVSRVRAFGSAAIRLRRHQLGRLLFAIWQSSGNKSSRALPVNNSLDGSRGFRNKGHWPMALHGELVAVKKCLDFFPPHISPFDALTYRSQSIRHPTVKCHLSDSARRYPTNSARQQEEKE